MTKSYPNWVPEPLAQVLGMPPYELHPVWMAMREVGIEVPTRYEAEVGAALAFLTPFAILHGDNWGRAATAELKRLKEGGEFRPIALMTVPAEPPRLVTADRHRLRLALQAASHALRSYQYGNASPELAKATADGCDQALGFHP